MPKKLERELKREAKKKGLSKEREELERMQKQEENKKK